MPRKRTTPAHPELIEAARFRSGLRARLPHICTVCGASFVGLKQAQFCSNKCRQKAFQAKKKSPKSSDSPSGPVD